MPFIQCISVISATSDAIQLNFLFAHIAICKKNKRKNIIEFHMQITIYPCQTNIK